MKNLVIVESPAKAKTIKKYLGKEFYVLASYGHVRDLIPKEGAVDTERDFAMKYQLIDRNKRHVDEITKALKNSDALYLATDPDREGEAISWHIYEIMKAKKILKSKEVYRVAFHEITKSAIKNAIDNARDISMDLVDAQQARRALDYLVGFNLSPLLWKKVRRGLSAGRVQSPALRMIVERETEIEKFVTQEYWSIAAEINKSNQSFVAKLTVYNGEKLKQFSITTEDKAKKAENELLKHANGKLIVSKLEKKQRKRRPSPPFITSTLQQEAARKLGFTAKRTMRTAQQLYENGLITYMRTDSVNLAGEALDDIRQLIHDKYGKENLPKTANFYKTKSKNAQEAHEAVRPTAASRIPNELKPDLSDDQYKLYSLIWKRTVASQMIPALIDIVAADLSCGKNSIFHATGSTITKPGFISVYQEGMDDKKAGDGDEKNLPQLKEGEIVELLNINSRQHFTEPLPRYSEASLIKALEEHDIGRPSTYASIISTIQDRGYVVLDNKRFKPTDVGRIVSKFLTKYFTKYVDYSFTAELEGQLDAVARGEKKWIPLLKDFWQPFIHQVHEIDETVQRKDVTQEAIDEECPKCGKPLSIRLGKGGRFIGCTGYPDCDYTRNVDGSEKEEPEIVEGRLCPKCDSHLIIRHGKYGKFIGCSSYPKCKFIESLEKPVDTGVKCPICKKGSMLKRKSRKGKIFYSCSDYPKCTYAAWNDPVDEQCPKCGWSMLTKKENKKGKFKLCPQKACDYLEDVE